MKNRIPDYFQLHKYNVTPETIVGYYLGCDRNAIRPNVIVTPIWPVKVFSQVAGNITSIKERRVYQMEYKGHLITLIRSGIGAPLTGDVILALGCTHCERLIFTGSVGGLDPSMEIGDLVVPEKSFSGDGFSRYLEKDIRTTNCFLDPAEPDAHDTRNVKAIAAKICEKESVALHSGAVFSIDTVLAQFFHLDYVVRRYECIEIEMETAAVFKAAKLVGIKASALLQVSDVIPKNKTIYSGRTKEEMQRQRTIRERIVAQAVVDAIIYN